MRASLLFLFRRAGGTRCDEIIRNEENSGEHDSRQRSQAAAMVVSATDAGEASHRRAFRRGNRCRRHDGTSYGSIDEHPIRPGTGLPHRNPFHLVRPLTRRRRRACPASHQLVTGGMDGHGGIRSGRRRFGFGSDANMPFFSDHAGYFWLYGIVLIPCIMLLLPKRWFVVQPRTDTDAQPME